MIRRRRTAQLALRTRQAFPGNIIPANRISTIAKYFESMLPNPINNQLQNNFIGVSQSGQDND